jgi:hypothetical protein
MLNLFTLDGSINHLLPTLFKRKDRDGLINYFLKHIPGKLSKLILSEIPQERLDAVKTFEQFLDLYFITASQLNQKLREHHSLSKALFKASTDVITSEHNNKIDKDSRNNKYDIKRSNTRVAYLHNEN